MSIMNFKILTTLICLNLFYLTNSAGAQQQIPLANEPRRELSSISQFGSLLEKKIKQESPLFYLFLLELEQYQQRVEPSLQEQAEEELREMLQQSPPLQKLLMEQQ
jgi:hypothetical protein